MIMRSAKVCRCCGKDLASESSSAAMQNAYQAAKGTIDDVRLRPAAHASPQAEKNAQNSFALRPEPAWVTGFRALDPGKRFAIIWVIGVPSVLVTALILFGWLHSLSPKPGLTISEPSHPTPSGAQSSTSHNASESVSTPIARENSSTVIVGVAPPPWLQLRQGVGAYTGDDGGGASTLTVCPSANHYRKWSSSATAVVPECREKHKGIPVTINSHEIVMSGLGGEYFVSITADDFSWSGWTGSLGLQPRTPANTKAVVKTLSPEGETWFFPSRTSADGHVVLRTGATLQILAQDPKSADRPDLYAQITGNSIDAGKKGWLHRLGLNVQGDVPLLFAPPNEIKPLAVAELNEASGNRIVIHGPVWSCPTIEMLRKLVRAADETPEKDKTMLSLQAHFGWNCELFTAGDVVYIDDHDGPFARVHKSAEIKEFWTLTSLLTK
ncbi:MAG: hypothetical protein WCA23_30175 [Stellaceae bacterium]